MDPASYEYSKVKEFDNLFTIKTDGYKKTALFIHKTTKESYMVVSSLEQCKRQYFEKYHSITKATIYDIDMIISHKEEYDYATAYQLRNSIFDFKKMGQSFLIDEYRYRYMVYLCVSNVEIPARAVLLSKNTVMIPETYLPIGQYKQYEQYHICPGPYEHAYDLPVKFIDKVIIKIEKY